MLLAGAAVLAGAMAGCADEPVTLDSPDVSATDLATCQAFLDDLPDTLAGQERRKVNPAAALGRAWGDPAIVVRCGVGVPADFDETSHCDIADDVGWFVPDEAFDDQEADLVLTAVGYEPVVELQIPHDYRPEGVAAAMTGLAPAVKEHLDQVQQCQ